MALAKDVRIPCCAGLARQDHSTFSQDAGSLRSTPHTVLCTVFNYGDGDDTLGHFPAVWFLQTKSYRAERLAVSTLGFEREQLALSKLSSTLLKPN